MDFKRFNNAVQERIAEYVLLMVPKGEEYSRKGDRLHNFKVAGRIDGITPEKALRGMDLKHRTSIADIIDDIEEGKLPSLKVLAEKMNDSHVYLHLLEALIVERIEMPGAARVEAGETDTYFKAFDEDIRDA